jgi:hypothetical protein
MFPNFNNTVERELLIMAIQELEDIVIVRTNLRAWRILGLEAND